MSFQQVRREILGAVGLSFRRASQGEMVVSRRDIRWLVGFFSEVACLDARKSFMAKIRP